MHALCTGCEVKAKVAVLEEVGLSKPVSFVGHLAFAYRANIIFLNIELEVTRKAYECVQVFCMVHVIAQYLEVLIEHDHVGV